MADATINNRSVQKTVKKKSTFRRSILLKGILPLIFKIYSLGTIDKNLVIFADSRLCELPTNMKGLYEELRGRGFNTKCFLDYPDKPKIKWFSKLKRLRSHIAFTKYYAKANYVVVGDYFLPIYANHPRKGQKIVQVWHGGGAFKKFGYSTLETTWGSSVDIVGKFPIHNTYTHVIVSSSCVISKYAEAFNCSEEIIQPYGLLRSDVFFDDDYHKCSKNKLLELFPQIGSRKIILYAPTFRGNSVKNAKNINRLNYEWLEHEFSDKYVIITKFHPFGKPDKNIFDSFQDFARDVTSDMEINEALCCADIVISDYSSLVFEFSLLERPMLFFAYDFDEYYDGRGFYYPYEDFVPGPVVHSSKELIDKLKNIDEWFDVQGVRDFKEKYMGGCDGNVTKRVADKIFGFPKN